MDPTHPYSMSAENLNALLDMEVWDLLQWRVVLASDVQQILSCDPLRSLLPYVMSSLLYHPLLPLLPLLYATSAHLPHSPGYFTRTFLMTPSGTACPQGRW